MNSVAIVGAGITGLTAAFRLHQRGVPVTVFEAGDRPGGVIRSHHKNGYLAESGPNTLLETSPRIRQLLVDLGLMGQIIPSNPAAHRRYLVRNGHPCELPGSIHGWLRSDLFSLAGKLRVLGDLLLPRIAADLEENVAQFVVRRLGPEFLERAIDPMIAGIYAGDPAQLSVREAFPRLHAAEQRHRSLFLAQMLGAKELRRRGEVPRAHAPKLSFPQGLETLVRALAQPLALSGTLLTKTRVTQIRKHGTVWELTSESDADTTTSEHDALILTAPAHRLARIAWEVDDDSLAWLGDIVYAPVTALVLGFRRADVAHPLDGFGVLVPEVENLPILGAIFSSSLFPGRAPEGHVTLTCYLGGTRNPDLALASLPAQLESTLAALRSLLGVRGTPTFMHQAVHPKGIAQYNLGFSRFRDRMAAMEAAHTGLRFAGHFRNGISLGDAILAGEDVATSLSAHFRTIASQPAEVSIDSNPS